MKDEVIELLAPELVARYRKWRPRFTAGLVLSLLLFVLAHVVAIIDVNSVTIKYNVLAVVFYVAGIVVFVGVMVWEKRFTRGISELGTLFSTKPRILVTTACMVATMVTYANLNAIYDSF